MPGPEREAPRPVGALTSTSISGRSARHDLPKRLTPPPERVGPPDLSLFLYAGIVIAIVLVILALPGVIRLLFDVLFV